MVEDQAFGVSSRVLLSLAPRRDLHGCDFNLFGHHHAGFLFHPERIKEWGCQRLVERSPNPYPNLSVEFIG